MANQNPQPSMLTARFDVPFGAAGAIAVGTTFSNVVTTQQAYNEIIYIYGLNVQALGDDGLQDSSLADVNWDVQIVSGPNSVPTNDFDFAYIYNRADKTIAFSSPIVVTHRQPLQVVLERTGAGAAITQSSTFLVTLIGDLVVMA
tara:strand:+ start:3554 stop:3988 length:435 start_codon:yes stop_codon:yes gene_type:complete